MAVVDFGVKDQKDRIINEGSNYSFWIGPGCGLVKVFGQLVEAATVTKM